MRTVFWDWDRANLETFFVELPMTHTIHNIQLSWFQMVRFKLFWPPTKVYLFQPLTTLPQIFVGHAEMLLDGKITWNLLGGSPPSMFHRCSWGLPRQGSVVWRLVGRAPGIKFCPTCRRWHVPELKVSWSWNRWMDGCCVPIFGGSATGREFLATPDSATQWFPKMMIFFFHGRSGMKTMITTAVHIFCGLSCRHHTERFPRRSRKWIWNCLLKPGRFCPMCQKKTNPKIQSTKKGRYSPYETQWNTTTSTYTWNMRPGTLLEFIS